MIKIAEAIGLKQIWLKFLEFVLETVFQQYGVNNMVNKINLLKLFSKRNGELLLKKEGNFQSYISGMQPTRIPLNRNDQQTAVN